MEKIIQQGAEAVIIKKGNIIIKRRITKSYRFPLLDEKIRKQRTKKESNLLKKAYNLIPTPKIIKVDEKTKPQDLLNLTNLDGAQEPKDKKRFLTEIEMEFIKGKKLSDSLNSFKNKLKISKKIGKQIAKLHDNDIIHGDLTTSNIILSKNALYFIDFGLGFISNKFEDKAVDLHLIKQALEAKHYEISKECFKEIIEGYSSSKNSSLALTRLKKVEARGRYKQ